MCGGYLYTLENSDCVTEYVGGTCVDLCPGYLHLNWTLSEVESVKPANCRLRVFNREFERYSGFLFLQQYTFEGSGGVTECVWGTCVDLRPG